MSVSLPLVSQLKLAPGLILSAWPLLPALAPERLRRIVLRLVLSTWGALCTATLTVSVALWLFPSITPDGHAVMPIGQVAIGGLLGAVSGLLLFARLAPGAHGDVQQLARWCALSTPLLLAACLWHVA